MEECYMAGSNDIVFAALVFSTIALAVTRARQ